MALIDTERKSARKYAPPKGQKPRKHEFEFDDGNLSKFGPEDYIEAIQEAGKLKYHTLIIDSLSHAWFGVGGELELVDNAAKRMKENRYYAWRDVTPLHNKLVDTILRSSCHIIATMRAKTTYEIIRDEKGSFLKAEKVGIEPIQRDGLEYEFDVIGDLNQDNTLVMSKSRCPALNRAVIKQPGEEVAQALLEWLSDAAPMTDNEIVKLVEYIPVVIKNLNIQNEQEALEFVVQNCKAEFGVEDLRHIPGDKIDALKDFLNENQTTALREKGYIKGEEE